MKVPLEFKKNGRDLTLNRSLLSITYRNILVSLLASFSHKFGRTSIFFFVRIYLCYWTPAADAGSLALRVPSKYGHS
jgi:hypothetical protein